MRKHIKQVMMIGAIASVMGGCTKLNEVIYDESSAVGLTDKQQAEGAIAPVYALLPSMFQHTRYFTLQEISTDEAILPYRGGTDWGDNGIYLGMHTHNFSTSDPNIRNVFNDLAKSVSYCVTAINTLPNNTDPSAPLYLAEARGMRAYYSLMLLDLYGLIFVKEDPKANSVILRGAEAVEYIKSELLAVEPLLGNQPTHGRLSKAAVWGLLARLHLNAPVYSDIYASQFNFGTADMDKVLEYCDKIISSGAYQFSPEYFEIFDDENNTNKEIIFAVDQRAELNGHNRLAYFSLSGDQFPLPQYPGANGTDGPGITSDFYDSWEDAYGATDPADADQRFYKENLSIYSNPNDTCVAADDFHVNRGILRGQQYGLIRREGVFLRCANGNYKVGPLFHDTRNRPTLAVNFTKEIDFSVAGSNYPSGYRVEKYEFSRKSVSGRNFGEANIVILRLADIYLMRAEAKLRKGDAAGALADVNTVRAARTARGTIPALTEMNLDILYRERGFELYWEMVRRTDMIRFGKYEGTWTEKTDNNPQKRLFPIPQNAIDGASNIPDYLVQNPGY
ncbi:RagB/SusD family nutrient uptake outer membrane protein [Flavihumibacter sp. UBA7668]|uniref:RagB/SusD family nutrient uptake outer membrane protein n=1 Tax=Flavihumibacter sp. UBA7668 TaxID=1946542 RepID=UPI0025BE379C|nr:RagB/SusD family nutrient uptake outer membrane protein [Flavihumibacter sp. UBA7668]